MGEMDRRCAGCFQPESSAVVHLSLNCFHKVFFGNKIQIIKKIYFSINNMLYYFQTRYNTSLLITSLVQVLFNGSLESVDKVKICQALVSCFVFLE